jgi:3-oxoacyl-[acyl-carrier-protein] synthase II
MSTNSDRRVVITGLGVISPLGNTKEDLWQALRSGAGGVRELQSVPAEHLPTRAGAEAWNFSGHIDDYGELEKNLKKQIRKSSKIMCREIQFGIAAAQRALADAARGPADRDPDRIGVVFGADYMMTLPDDFVDGVTQCLDDEQKFDFAKWAHSGLPKVEPLWLLKYLPNMPASYLAIFNDLRGPNNSITIREASSNLAISEAFHIISRGGADVMVSGATGTRIHPVRTIHIALQEELADRSADPAAASRPFDAGRTGMVLGEGAGSLILEELSFATKRGAPIYGEVLACSSSSVMDVSGAADRRKALANAVRTALTRAGLTPADVGHYSAHGLSTVQGDIEEALAVQDALSVGETTVPVTAAKSYFGNLGAGSGMVETAASLLAMQHGELFGTLNYEQPDPECPVNIAPAGSPPGDVFVSANVTPQGQAAAVVIRKFA